MRQSISQKRNVLEVLPSTICSVLCTLWMRPVLEIFAYFKMLFGAATKYGRFSARIISRCITLGAFLVLPLVQSIPIDNGVVGTPEVSCGQRDMSILFNTEKPFGGRIFAKGFADSPGCFLRGEGTRSVSVSFNLNTQACGIRRIRSVEPRGMQVMVVTVISFHAIFLTKVDKAYRLSCFYMEADKSITSELEVQMLTTQVITSSVPMPSCKYEILRGDLNGPAVRFVRIGDPVYHKWTCASVSQDSFCMRVHTCSVDDGSGSSRIPVIDASGCSLDKYVIGDLEYYDDMTVGREAHVFKFADHPLVFFNCQIELSLKEQPTCSSKRPICSGALESPQEYKLKQKQRRALELAANFSDFEGFSTTNTFADFDLPPIELTVLDLDDHINSRSISQSIQDELTAEDEDGQVSSRQSVEVCLSPIGLALAGTVACAIAVTSIVTIFVVVARKPEDIIKVS